MIPDVECTVTNALYSQANDVNTMALAKSSVFETTFEKIGFQYQHGHFYNSLNVASELKALPLYSNIVLLAQLLPNAALSVHAGSQ
jgi:hypothetical protein